MTWPEVGYGLSVVVVVLLYLLLSRLPDKGHSRQLDTINHQGNRIMAVAQDILDAVTASRAEQDALSNTVAQLVTTVDQIIAKVIELKESGAITEEQAEAIIGTATADRDSAQTANAAAATANQKLHDTLTNLQG